MSSQPIEPLVASPGKWDHDLATDQVLCDSDALCMLGLTPAEGVLDPAAWLRRIHPEDRERVRADYAEALRTHGAFRGLYRVQRPQGDMCWIEHSGRVLQGRDGAPSLLAGICTDVSARLAADQHVREREQRLRALFSGIDEGYCLCEMLVDAAGRPVDYRFLEVNASFERMTGYTNAEGRTVLELQPDLEPHWVHTYARVAFEGQSMRFESGSLAMGRWFEVFAMPVEPRGHFALVFKDVSARKQAEDALRRSEAQFRTTAEALPGILYLATPTGENLYVNRSFCAYTGRTQEELLGMKWRDVIHPEDLVAAEAAWSVSVSTRQPFRAEMRVRRHDGEWRWQQAHALPMDKCEGVDECWLGVALDIHDRKLLEGELREFNQRLERLVAERTRALSEAARELQAEMLRRGQAQAALLQSQKLEAVGQLTSGLAHDFNNILAAMQGTCKLLGARVAGDPTSEELVGIGMRAADRGAKLVAQLMAFTRKEDLRPSLVDPAQLLPATESMIRQTVGQQVKVRLHGEPGVWPVLVDPVRLETVLLNLAANARDAMPEGGTLEITARNADAGCLPDELASARDWVLIRIADTGAGMDPEVLRRATEPFFTTKGPGKGTGLGLSTAHLFAVQSGGTLRLHSAPGKGTAIELFLPRAAVLRAPSSNGRDRAEPGASEPSADARASERPTVLVVDDDDAVRPVTAGMLRELGYHVLEAASAEAAEAIAHAEPGFDLLVTDVVMGGASGPVLAARLRSERPDLPVLYMTGHSGAEQLTDAPVLRKPFTDEALSDAVLRLIGREA